MVHLLRQRNRLRHSLSDLHPHTIARRRDGHLVVTQLADDVERLLHRLLLREPQRVRLHLRFHRRPHVRRHTEKAIRRCQPLERLVRALEVVTVDV
jgi:hypothetical protein